MAAQSGGLEEAYIRIVGDMSEFDRDVVKGARETFAKVASLGARMANELEGSSASAAASIRNLFNVNNSGRYIEDVRLLAQKLDDLEPKFRQLGDEGEKAFNRLISLTRELDARIDTGLTASLNRVADSTERFETRVRQAFGRAAVAGTEQFEASLNDLSDVTRNELDDVDRQIRSAFKELGNIPELRRLRDQIVDLSNEIEGDFTRAVEGSKGELRELAATGELTAGDLRRSVGELARTFDSGISESVQSVREELRLLRGDASAFNDLAEEADRAEQEARELQDALLDLERRNHDRLAEEFRQAADAAEETKAEIDDIRLAVERLNDADPDLADAFRRGEVSASEFLDQLRHVDDELEEVGDRGIRTGNDIRRGVLRGNDAFGSLVASANRFRFVMLDLRFLAGAVGTAMVAEFARFGIEAASQIEQAKISFQVLARSIEGDMTQSFEEFEGQASVAMESVIEYARETPYSLGDVTEAVRRLSAYLPSLGTASEESLGTLQGRTEESIALFDDLGGALAVLGQQDALPRLVKALGDVGARGKLTAEEVRQIANAVPGLEVRTAIITGLFDPMVQSSDQIEFLREQFGALGADATQAPQEALAAFTKFQSEGLITADAVVEGLRASFRNLAGEDALQAFTQTIDGVLEKLREAAEVGASRGFAELGPSLIEEILPSLELVEEASETFAEGLTELATDVAPYVLDAFEGFTETFGGIFDGMSDVIGRNAEEIESTMSEVGEFAQGAADLFVDAFELLIDISPELAEIGNVGLATVIEAFEIFGPILEDTVELIAALPDELIAIATAFRYLGGRQALGFVEGMRDRFKELGTELANAKTVASRASSLFSAAFAPGVFIGLAGASVLMKEFEEATERGIERAEEFAEQALRIRDDTPTLELGGALDNQQVRLSGEFERLRAIVDEEQGKLFFDPFASSDNLALGVSAPFVRALGEFEYAIRNHFNPAAAEAAAAADLVVDKFEDADTASRNIDSALYELRLKLINVADTGFDKVSLAAVLTEDVMGQVADATGLTKDEMIVLASEGSDVLADALLDLLDNGELLPEVFEDIEVEADKVTLQTAITAANDVEGAFSDAAEEIRNVADALRAQNDPVFAALDAEQGQVEAQEAYEEALAGVAAAEEGASDAAKEAQSDREKAVRDLEDVNSRLKELRAEDDPSDDSIRSAENQAADLRDTIAEIDETIAGSGEARDAALAEANAAVDEAARGIVDATLASTYAFLDLDAAIVDPERDVSIQGTRDFVADMLRTIGDDTPGARRALELLDEVIAGLPGSAAEAAGATGAAVEGIQLRFNQGAIALQEDVRVFGQNVTGFVDVADGGLHNLVASAETASEDVSGAFKEAANGSDQHLNNLAGDIFKAGQKSEAAARRSFEGVPESIRAPLLRANREVDNSMDKVPTSVRAGLDRADTAAAQGMDDVAVTFGHGGYNAGTSAADGLEETAGNFQTRARGIGDKGSAALLQGFEVLPSRMYTAGEDAIDGFFDGTTYKDPFTHGERIANALLGGVRGGLQAKSPSQAMKEVGEDAIAGFELPFSDFPERMEEIGRSAGQRLVDGIRDATSEGLSVGNLTGLEKAVASGTIPSGGFSGGLDLDYSSPNARKGNKPYGNGATGQNLLNGGGSRVSIENFTFSPQYPPTVDTEDSIRRCLSQIDFL